MSTQVYQEVTNAIVAQLEQGTAPWVRPWSTTAVPANQRGRMAPHNVASNRDYNGINILILGMTAAAKGYPTGAWATYKQIRARGGQVRKGERGTIIVYWDRIQVKDRTEGAAEDATKMVPLVKTFVVFNIEQADWEKDPLRREVTEAPGFELLDCEQTILGSGAIIKHRGDRAMYVPSIDQIYVPVKKAFRQAVGYYSTVFHELVHWTGHESRLDRDLSKGRYGDPEYAFEELVAELGASFLCAKHGVDGHLEHNASYIQNWLRVLHDDPQAIFRAASLAQKAADYVLIGQADAEEAAA